MRIFTCQACQQLLYFENTECERCHRKLGYICTLGTISAVEPAGSEWIALADPKRRYRFCANWEAGVCNWLVAADEHEKFCLACQHNRTVPDVSDPVRLQQWRKIEEAKRRLFYTLIKLKLPMPTAASGDPEPLTFDFLADPPSPEAARVMTGHDNGLITISLGEADDAEREKLRTAMGERYRTILGHFRHEVGHYYWDKLVRDRNEIASFRKLFGDETADYGEALKRHYANGPPPNWRDSYVSAYATTHPWEDWAETWAHYFHIVDTLEMADAFGVRIAPKVAAEPELEAEIDLDPHRVRRVSRLIEAWLPLVFAVNSINRSMGQPDLYPFVLPPPVIEKLSYIHQVIRRA
jgi:hypothetical protein